MPKTVSKTIADIVVADVSSVTITGPLDDPAKLVIHAVATLLDDVTGDVIEALGFKVEDLSSGQAVALSNILKNDVVAAANVALQVRAGADVTIAAAIPPV